MPTYKLIYFDARARAEVARMLFELSDTQYEDERIDYEKDWSKIRASKLQISFLFLKKTPAFSYCLFKFKKRLTLKF